MKKLRLEALEVTSFDTDAAEVDERGTVHAHATAKVACDTWICPTTPQMDCTYGCTQFGDCVTSERCLLLTELDCV